MPDLLLLGATGTTGRVAAAHLSRHAGAIRWTVAGRDPGRLMELVRSLPGPSLPTARRLDVTAADDVDAAVSAHRVVLNAAGPYTRLAPPVVAACARTGADYVDLTGELMFVAQCIAQHDASARQSGARIVQVCGFEALPFDLLVRLAAERSDDDGDDVLVEAGLVFTADVSKGPGQLLSRGTFESGLGILSSEGAERLTDVTLLLPPSADAAAVRRTAHRPGLPWASADHGPVGPLVPSPLINPPVILRSAALLGVDAGYAPELAYREGVSFRGVVPGPLRPFAAGFAAAAQLSLGLVLRAPRPLRKAAATALAPLGPRGGPAEDEGADFEWSIALEGRTRAGRQIRARVDAHGHPGYGTTGTAFAEVGLAFAEDEPSLPAVAGHVTPAVALGVAAPVLERLARGRLRFAVTD